MLPRVDLDHLSSADLKALVIRLMERIAGLEHTVAALREEIARLKGLKMLPPRPTRRRLQRSHDLEAATGLWHPLPTLRKRRCRRPRKARFRLAG